MPVLNFPPKSGRRPTTASGARVAQPVTDRWAMLHSGATAQNATAEVISLPPARDFWGDLLLKLAYPTHMLRRH